MNIHILLIVVMPTFTEYSLCYWPLNKIERLCINTAACCMLLTGYRSKSRVTVGVSVFTRIEISARYARQTRERKHDFMDDFSQSDLIISNGLLNWETFITQPLFLSHKFKYPGGKALFFCHKCDGGILQVLSDLYHLKIYTLSLSNMTQKWIKWISTTAYVLLKHRLSYKSGICFIHNTTADIRSEKHPILFVMLMKNKRKHATNLQQSHKKKAPAAGMGLSPPFYSGWAAGEKLDL